MYVKKENCGSWGIILVHEAVNALVRHLHFAEVEHGDSKLYKPSDGDRNDM